MSNGEFYLGDALTVLKSLPNNYFHAAITSPPYFNQRDYSHPKQIGKENSEEEYINSLIEIFRELMRVLREDALFWLNIGDKYGGKNGLRNIPHLLISELQKDGWIWISEIIWHKTNPMPEPVINRPTRSHEFIFLLAKRKKYYYDQQGFTEESKANIRDTWNFSTSKNKGNNFATFPRELPKRCILLSTSEKGCCDICGLQVIRIVQREHMVINRSSRKERMEKYGIYQSSGSQQKPNINTTIGWEKHCKCDAETVPSRVIDPFAGTGTTLQVAKELGRYSVGIELNPEYYSEALKRLQSNE